MIYAYTYSIINYKVSNTKQPRKPKALDTTHVNFNRNDDRAVIYTSDNTMMTKFNKLVEIAGTEWKDIVLDLMNCTDEELLYVYHELSEESRAGFSNLFTILIAVKRYRVLAKKLGHSEV